MSNKKESISLQSASGACAGVVADLFTHPIDTVRTRLQVQKSSNTNQVVYRNTWDALSTIIKTEGPLSLYKGVGIVFFSTIPAHALYFSGYEMVKRNLEPHKLDEEKSSWVHFVAGLWAEVCGATIWVPQDVVKQRLQIQRGSKDSKYKGSFHALTTIFREEGLKGLFKGYTAGIATYGPFVGIYFVAYEQSKHFFRKLVGAKSVDDLSMPFYLISGAQSGAFAAAVTCPMDVIKTRIQTQSTSTNSSEKYKGNIDAITRIYKEEGIRAFGKGMSARILWIAPGTAITIAAYEKFKRILSDWL